MKRTKSLTEPPAPDNVKRLTDPVYQLAFAMEEPLNDLWHGLDALMLIQEALTDEESRGLYFVACGLHDAHKRAKEIWQKLFDVAKERAGAA